MRVGASLFLLAIAGHCSLFAQAFQANPTFVRVRSSSVSTRLRDYDTSAVEQVLERDYPIFMSLINKNEGVWKKLRQAEDGVTIFAPNDKAFADLGQGKLEQLQDPRNTESKEKIGAYHTIAEPVTAEEIFASGGIITIGGDIPVGRSVTGGFFGVGGKEDGGVTVNGANVVKTTEVENSIIHEVDALVSPNILWRYIDQLRIPGSK